MVTPVLLFGQGKTIILGKVTDSAKMVLENVTVQLYRVRDSAISQTAITDKKGEFLFNKAQPDTYFLRLSKEGYKKITIPFIKASDSIVFVPSIVLAYTTKDLGNVTVIGTKPLIETKDDRVIYNVESDPAAKTETAIDILRKTPFVSVDGDNNVLVNGKSNFKVLLNGKETAMFTQNVKDALKSFPGAVILKIEVITSPSAKYDAEGVGGIINIITRKALKGYVGSFSTFTTFPNRSGGLNGNFSLKTGNVGLSLFYSANGASDVPSTTFNRTIPFKSSFYSERTIVGERVFDYFSQFGNIELSWDIDSLNIMSFYGNLAGGNNSRTDDQNILTTLTNPTSSALSTNHYYTEGQTPSYNAGLDYIKKYKGSPGKELDLKFFGEFSSNNSFAVTSQLSTSANRFMSNNNVSDNTQYTLELNYNLPMKQGQKLETGIKTIFRQATADFQSLITYDISKPYTMDPSNSNNFRYRQNVLSAYGSYGFKLKNYSFRLGARVENTTINGEFISYGSIVQQNYTNIIPNIQVIRKFSTVYSTVLTYSIRLQRPFITNLNPFKYYNDSLNISFGNPNLGPQTIHIVSVQNRIQKGSTFMGVTVSGSYSNNAIETYATFDPSKGVISTTSANIGREIQFIVNANISTKFSNAWRFSVNGSVGYSYAVNKFMSTQSNNGISSNISISNTITVNKNLTISSFTGFYAFPITVQTKRSIQHYYSISAGYKFMHEKFSGNISINNFLSKDIRFRTTTLDPYFENISEFTNPFRVFAVSISWYFGKLKENISRKKGVVNDDLL